MPKKQESPDAESYTRKRKWLAGVSLAVVVVLVGLATWFIWSWLASFSQEGFRDYIRSFGWAGWLVLLGLQFLQVFIALIPGELLETAAGFAFGPWLGTLLCYVGVALASALIFVLTKRFGIRLVEIFVSREKISELRFLNNEKKRNFLIFLLYFIPGTPKDLLTYFAGLTDIKLHEFLIISLIARFPSVISSTIGGHLLGEAAYWPAIVLYAATGAVSVIGLLAYNAVIRRKQHKKDRSE